MPPAADIIPLRQGEAPAPSAEAEPESTWLLLDQVLELGASRATAYRRMRDGDWEWREAQAGREVRLESLDRGLRRRWGRQQGQARVQEAAELPARVPREAAYAEAGRRWQILQQWGALSVRARKGAPGTALREEYAEAPAGLVALAPSLGRVPHPGSLDRVLSRVRHVFDAGQNGALYTLGRLSPRQTERAPTLPAEAEAYVRELWMRRRAGTKVMVHDAYVREARKRGWPSVSYDTIRRVIDATPSDLQVLARRGEREWRGTTAQFLQRDFSDLAAGDVWVGDHHQFDVFVRDEKSGELYRPWITAWQDHRSRAVPGWVTCRAPNSRTIMQAFAVGVRPKYRPEYAQMAGLPGGVYVDNGKDYRSHALEGVQVVRAGLDADDLQLMRGLFPSLEIDVQHARAYNARAKIVERWFGSMARDFDARCPGYCGHDNKDRTDYLERSMQRHKAWLRNERRETPFLTLHELTELLEVWIYGYHTRAHRSLSTGGRQMSPVDAWRLYGREPVMVRDATLELLCMERAMRTIQKNGIELRGHWYRSDELVARMGERVQVRMDPVDAGRVYVFTAAGQRIGEAVSAPLLRGRATPEQVAEACAEQRRYERRRKQALKALTEDAPRGALDLVETLRESAPPPQDDPVVPEQAIRRMVPALDRVPLRSVEVPPGPSVTMDPPAEQPATRPLRLLACDVEWEEEHSSSAAKGGR